MNKITNNLECFILYTFEWVIYLYRVIQCNVTCSQNCFYLNYVIQNYDETMMSIRKLAITFDKVGVMQWTKLRDENNLYSTA